jgi:hypothetical protein
MQELIYVSAQPDIQYFHWQCEIYGFNFLEQGIKPENIHMIFGMVNTNKPSQYAMNLKKKGFNVHFFEDKREDKTYIPSIKPYLISHWLKKNPEYGEFFFLHDSDIIFREKPNYEKFLDDKICYLADTKSYISYDYLKNCENNYSKVYKLQDFEMINGMLDIFGLELECLMGHNDNSGGGQYIIKKTNYKNWFKIYKDSILLYDYLINFSLKYPLNNGIQIWTAEMWSLLWNLWCLEKDTKIIEELNFSWATDNVDIYNKRPILHMAGVLDKDKNKKFYKGEFINVSPIDKLIKDKNYFDYVESESSTIKYVEVFKSFLEKTKF